LYYDSKLDFGNVKNRDTILVTWHDFLGRT